MKKTHPNGAPRAKTPRHGASHKEGRWEIKSQSLHTLGGDGSLLRPVYRTSSGEVRFLALWFDHGAIATVAIGTATRQLQAVREIYSSVNVPEVGFFKSLLDEAGILCYIRNENPPDPGAPAFYPTLCIIDDADYDRAVQLLEARRVTAGIQRPDWKCPSCSETNPGNFEICWKCQAARPWSAK